IKPLNLIMLINNVPLNNIKKVLFSITKKLNKLDTPPYYISIQFFQVGNEESAKEALEELNDRLSELPHGDIYDHDFTYPSYPSLSRPSMYQCRAIVRF
ncbi:hypothetical protein BKA61DRAFT_496305, partial [Leptodontidium sp. MPI-SDFR-AT-0119]